MPLLEARDLKKIFPVNARAWGGRDAEETRAVDGVSLELDPGETLGLVGESGSGKSTLGRLLLRLIEPTSGSLSFAGRDVFAANPRQLRALRREMQIVFQDPFGSLDPRMRVRDILNEPFRIHAINGGGDLPSWRASELLGAVGMDDSALLRFPHEFSGGQRQRVGIARALALRPKFMVCDEPVSALDVSVGAQIVNLLAQLQREFGIAYLFISHSLPVVRYIAHRVAIMQRGKIVESGDAVEILERPRHPYTRSLLASTPELPA